MIWNILWNELPQGSDKREGDFSIKTTTSKKEFQRHEQMQKALDYIVENLRGEITLEALCEKTKYSSTYFVKKFREYYGHPWERFVNMLRMRMAAEEILKGGGNSLILLAEKYGFSGPNAFYKAFKRELGVSPTEFRKNGVEVPDIPIPENINGKKLFRHFLTSQDRHILGKIIKPEIPMDRETILSDCAYPLDHCMDIFQFKGPLDQIGLWWGEKRDEYLYVLGHEIMPEQEVRQYEETGMKRLILPGSSYALFTIEISDTLEETLRNHRAMVYYVMKVWQKINHKVGNIMRYTYEEFTQNYTRLWFPLYEGMPQNESIHDYNDRGTRSWIPYIDQNLTSNMLIEDMAAFYNYSERHLRRSFEDIHKISLSEYIREKRLYKAAEEMNGLQGDKPKSIIVRKYNFRNLETFRRQFVDCFGAEPGDYLDVTSKLFNPAEHISGFQGKIQSSFQKIEELKMVGTILRKPEQDKSTWREMPIPEIAAYWMQHDSEGLVGTKYECKMPGTEDKIGIWIEGTKPGEPEYILGPVVDEFINIPEHFFQVRLPAGNYIVLESKQESDEYNLSDVYYMLRQYTDFEWFKQGRNMIRYNRSKKTFIRYYGRKLHYYIPVHY